LTFLAVPSKKKAMKQRIVLATAFVASGLLGLSAFAGPEPLPSGKEMKEVVPAPAPECNWTGFYIGLNVGGQFGHSEDKDLDDWNAEGQQWGYSESGVVAGGQVGYNFQWKWLVLGIEADGGYMNLDGSGVEPVAARDDGSDTSGHTDSDFFTTLRGRIGVALNRWLIYGTGGAIAVNYETRVVDDCSTEPCSPGLLDDHKQDFDWGYTVGGGAEYRFGCHWSVKAEYLYFDLGDVTFNGVANNGFTGSWRGDTMGHIVRAGLNYKF
jgi:outer membrane immunogenic protein